jgi:uncharacterized protein YecE (DUF72 family)
MTVSKKIKFYSGTSGLVLKIPKRSFPAEFSDKSRLHYYASIFNSIEVNSSFYKIPMASTVKKWSADVPPEFRFTFKLWKGITHNKGLMYEPDDIEHFIETINDVGDKKGCLLLQFPPSITLAHADQLEELLGYVREADPDMQWTTAVEFRHRSLYQQSIYNRLTDLKMALVFHDLPASISPLTDLGAGFIYLRFHGPSGDYRGSYNDGALLKQAATIHSWMDEGKTVYAYFNNTIGEAYDNLDTLNRDVTKL